MERDEMTLPQGWVWMTLGEIVERVSNGITLRQAKDGHGIPVTRIETISDGTINLQRVGYLADLPVDAIEKYRLHNGDVLFSHINSDLHLGKTAIYKLGNLVLLHGMNLLLLRPDPQTIAPEFLHYFCNHLRFSGEFLSIAQHAVNQSSINQAKLKQVPVPLAPFPEQHRIVAEIEKQFTRLDAGVAALRRARANLKRYKASVLKAACEGRLVPQDPNDEPASKLLERILAERRAKWEQDLRAKGKDPSKARYVEPATPNTDGLPELPCGWCWATWEQISPRVTVGFVGPMKHEYVEDGVPFLRSQNVRENRFDPEGLCYISPTFHQRISKSVLHPGDLVVVRSGSVGVTCVIPDTLPEANCADLVVIQKPACLEPAYGSYYMNSLAKRRVRAGQVGVALIHFNTRSVAALTIAVPPLAEQRRIVAEVERRLSVVQEVETVIAANLARAERLRQSILKQAFEGRLVPQDPNDEPASVLLERIKAQRVEATLAAAQKPARRSRSKSRA